VTVAGEQQVGRRFRVGLVVLVALAATMIGIFMIGQRANLFRSKFPYQTRFESAAGLIPGNNVSLNGVVVGSVLQVNLSGDPADRTVRVVYDVVRRWAPMLRKGTRASIKTRGLLGDKYIELEGGKASEPEVPIGGEIPAAPGAGLEKFLEGSGDLMADLSGIAKSLRNILGRTEKGEGFLGAITSNSEESVRLGNNLNATLHSLNAILGKIEHGQGLAGKLLIDEKYGRETSASLAGAIRSLQSLLGRIDDGIRTGNGAIPALLADPEGKKKVYALLDDLAMAAAGLARITQNLETGSGTIPILLHDEAFGKAFTRNLQSFSEHLDSIGRKLDEGDGTAGKLINDPAIFDAANRLVVGVDQSWFLRWLVKDRQKAAIKTEYKEVVRTRTAAAASAGASAAITPTPPPQ
jgi:phospholipid/cholesterol/gamma-HCH transport system substrate-binding protein